MHTALFLIFYLNQVVPPLTNREMPPIHPAGALLAGPTHRDHQLKGHPPGPSSLGPWLAGPTNRDHQQQGVPSFHQRGRQQAVNLPGETTESLKNLYVKKAARNPQKITGKEVPKSSSSV